MLRKPIVCILAACLLSGCYYSFKEGCLYTFDNVDCPMETKSELDTYVKAGVDDETKLADMKECLGIYGKNINVTRKTDIGFIAEQYVNRTVVTHTFYSCMVYKKGYTKDPPKYLYGERAGQPAYSY